MTNRPPSPRQEGVAQDSFRNNRVRRLPNRTRATRSSSPSGDREWRCEPATSARQPACAPSRSPIGQSVPANATLPRASIRVTVMPVLAFRLLRASARGWQSASLCVAWHGSRRGRPRGGSTSDPAVVEPQTQNVPKAAIARVQDLRVGVLDPWAERRHAQRPRVASSRARWKLSA